MQKEIGVTQKIMWKLFGKFYNIKKLKILLYLLKDVKCKKFC